MILANVQQFASERITANPLLAEFDQPILFSFFLDDEATRTLIATRLRTKGVCLEVGQVSASDDGSIPGRVAKLSVDFDVFAAEAIKTEHVPANLELAHEIIAAVTKPDKYETPVKCTAYDAMKSEHGYVLHVISFSTQVHIP